MLVHFIASRTELDEDIDNFLAIRQIINDLGHELALDWVGPTSDLIKKGEYKKVTSEADWKTINRDNMAALAKADVVIAEASARGFSTGYQVASAIQQKKPVLILSRHNDLGGTFSSGLMSDFLSNMVYDKKTLRPIVTKFIEENTINVKDMRFNFFIDRTIYNYLRWASFKTGKTKAEVLRELVKNEIEKKG